jgi:hypothetical protein
MTNDEFQMTKECQMTNDDTAASPAEILDCGGKRSATPLFHTSVAWNRDAKALSPLRSASTVQNRPRSFDIRHSTFVICGSSFVIHA